MNKEIKKLKEENAKLKSKLNDRDDDTLLVDILNGFLIDKNLVNDFKKYLHTHSMKDVYRKKDEVRELWKNL